MFTNEQSRLRLPVKKEELEKEVWSDEETSDTTLLAGQSLARSHPTSLFYIPVTVNGKIIWALMDSGAADNFISSRVVRQLGVQPKRLTQAMSVCVGNGDIIQSAEYVELFLDLGPFVTKTYLKVLGTPISMVLGYTFLIRHCPIVDWVKRELKFTKKWEIRMMKGYPAPVTVLAGMEEAEPLTPLTPLAGVQWTTPIVEQNEIR